MESPSNIGPVCGSCADEKYKPGLFAKVRLETFVGGYCKLAFPAPDGRREFMWVEVRGMAVTEGQELRGTLNNDPVIALEYHCGDIIEFKREEILAVC